MVQRIITGANEHLVIGKYYDHLPKTKKCLNMLGILGGNSGKITGISERVTLKSVGQIANCLKRSALKLL